MDHKDLSTRLYNKEVVSMNHSCRITVKRNGEGDGVKGLKYRESKDCLFVSSSIAPKPFTQEASCQEEGSRIIWTT